MAAGAHALHATPSSTMGEYGCLITLMGLHSPAPKVFYHLLPDVFKLIVYLLNSSFAC